MIFTQHPKTVLFGSLLLSSLVVTAAWIYPMIHGFGKQALLYLDFLDEQTPVIDVHKGGLVLHGDLPKTLVNKDGIRVVFDHIADESSLKDAAPKSLVVSDTVVLYKSAMKIHHIRLTGIDVDRSVVLEPTKVRGKIEHYFTVIVGVLTAAVAVLTLIALAITTLIGGGIGTIVDMNSKSSFTFVSLWSISGATMFIVTSVLAFLHGLKVSFPFSFWQYPVVYYCSAILITYVLVKKSDRATH